MYSHLNFSLLLIVAGVLLALSIIAAAIASRKYFPAIFQRGTPALQTAATQAAGDRFFSPLIDRPIDQRIAPTQKTAGIEEPMDDIPLDAFEEEESYLLKEAEWVVEQIQTVVDRITARPANPDEVFTKVRAIVSQYKIFEETEYYDAINNFVAVTVQRDCDLTLTADDLKALWWSEAA